MHQKKSNAKTYKIARDYLAAWATRLKNECFMTATYIRWVVKRWINCSAIWVTFLKLRCHPRYLYREHLYIYIYIYIYIYYIYLCKSLSHLIININRIFLKKYVDVFLKLIQQCAAKVDVDRIKKIQRRIEINKLIISRLKFMYLYLSKTYVIPEKII